MYQIKCPKCGEVFTPEKKELDSILSQIRNEDFEKQVEARTQEIRKNIENEASLKEKISATQHEAIIKDMQAKIDQAEAKLSTATIQSKNELEKWLEIIENKKKQRFVVLHNNLELSHYIRNDNSYLISWDKSKIDIPIFDLYKLYKKYALTFDFESILKEYEKIYPLLQEEIILFFVLITLPDKIEFKNSEYENTKLVSKKIDIIYKTEKLIEEYSKTKKEYTNNK